MFYEIPGQTGLSGIFMKVYYKVFRNDENCPLSIIKYMYEIIYGQEVKFMNETIKRLYNGSLNICENIHSQTDKGLSSKWSKAINDIAKIAGHEMADMLEDIHTMLINDISMHSFEYGLKTGIRLAADDDGHPP